MKSKLPKVIRDYINELESNPTRYRGRLHKTDVRKLASFAYSVGIGDWTYVPDSKRAPENAPIGLPEEYNPVLCMIEGEFGKNQEWGEMPAVLFHTKGEWHLAYSGDIMEEIVVKWKKIN